MKKTMITILVLLLCYFTNFAQTSNARGRIATGREPTG